MEPKRNDEEAQPSGDNGQANNLDAGLELVGTRSNIADREDVPPDGGYGWVCSIAFLFINAHTWGVNSVRDPTQPDLAPKQSQHPN